MSCVARGLGHIVSKEMKKLFKCITKVIKKKGFSLCKAEQPLQGMELQEKETQKD